MNSLIRILLIEDDQIDQQAFKRLLKRKNLPYNYSIVDSVIKAKQIIREQSFDIILADYKLKDGNSFEILDFIRETPVVFLTAYGDEETAVKAMKAGAYDYVIKDIDQHYLEVIPPLIDSVIKLKKAQDQYKSLTQLYEAVLENSLDGIIVIDFEGNLIYNNEAFEKMSKYDIKKLPNLKFADLIINSDFAIQIIESCKNNNRIINLETKIVPKSDQLVPVSLNAVSIVSLNKILISFRDLRVEKELTEELELFRKFALNHIHVSLIKIARIGPEVIFTEKLIFAPDKEEEILFRMGVFYAPALGQGQNIAVGFFGPLPITDVPGHIGYTYSFLINDPSNPDPRANKKSYCFLVFSMPESLENLFNNRRSIQKQIEDELKRFHKISDITLEALVVLKKHLLGLI